MSKRILHSVDVDVGVPPVLFRENKSFRVHFHRFEELDSKVDVPVESPTFRCFNRNWLVLIYPGGQSGATGDEKMISIYLINESPNCGEIAVYFTFLVGLKGLTLSDNKSDTFGAKNPSWGYKNRRKLKRTDLLKSDALNQGTLTIEVQMELNVAKSGVNFAPKNPVGEYIRRLFLDEGSADVLFELFSVKTSSKVQYHAHRLVLSACAPDLARLCEGADKSTPIPITDVEPDVFRQLLHYVHGGDISPNWESDAKNIMDAADKYGVIGLKVEAEGWYVSCSAFKVENAIEELLYADAKKCPLLREAALDFVLKNAKEVIKSDSFQNVLAAKEITVEIMLALASAEEGNDSTDETTNSMSINDLRMALYQKGLDIDGPRELLAARLNE